MVLKCGLIHLQIVCQERINICQFFDQNGSWFSGTMTRTSLDTDQGRCFASLAGLQAGCKLERMAGNHPIIVISGCDQGRRIFNTVF